MFNLSQRKSIAATVAKAVSHKQQNARLHCFAEFVGIEIRTLCKVLDAMPVRNIVYEKIRKALGLGTVWHLVWAEAEKDSLAACWGNLRKMWLEFWFGIMPEIGKKMLEKPHAKSDEPIPEQAPTILVRDDGTQVSLCCWAYKGLGCWIEEPNGKCVKKYGFVETDNDTCDKTIEDCKRHRNYERYAGLPYQTGGWPF